MNWSWEYTKQVLAGVVRGALTALGTFLVTKGWVSPELADAFLGEITSYIVGAIILAIPVIWKYFNAKYNILALVKAVQTDPPADSPKEVAKAVAEAQAEASASPTTTISY